jgi:hypothetical protein
VVFSHSSAYPRSKYSRLYFYEEAKAPHVVIGIFGGLGCAKEEADRDYTTSLVATYLFFESRSNYQA